MAFDKKTVTILFPIDLISDVDEQAHLEGKSRNRWILDAVSEALINREANPNFSLKKDEEEEGGDSDV
jgi:metal-responsive CopG/Arc/MetJ family transcriptional regulator